MPKTQLCPKLCIEATEYKENKTKGSGIQFELVIWEGIYTERSNDYKLIRRLYKIGTYAISSSKFPAVLQPDEKDLSAFQSSEKPSVSQRFLFFQRIKHTFYIWEITNKKNTIMEM